MVKKDDSQEGATTEGVTLLIDAIKNLRAGIFDSSDFTSELLTCLHSALPAREERLSIQINQIRLDVLISRIDSSIIH